MLTKTSILAVRALIHVAGHAEARAIPPKRIAEDIGESPTYLAKVSNLLVRAGIFRAEKGSKGGVQLSRPPAQISLLAVVEACQGAIIGNFCSVERDPSKTCSYHQAALELHEALTGVLARWNLAQLLAKPRPPRGNPDCMILNRNAAGHLVPIKIPPGPQAGSRLSSSPAGSRK